MEVPPNTPGTHECSQAVTLNTICMQLTEIKNDIGEIKTTQKTLVDTVQMSAIERAKYPTPEKVNEIIALVGTHQTFFMIGGALAGILIVGVIELIIKVF